MNSNEDESIDENERNYPQSQLTPTSLTIISNLIQEAKNLKSEGNSYFTTQNYAAAEVTYTRGLKVIQSVSAYVRKNAISSSTDGRMDVAISHDDNRASAKDDFMVEITIIKMNLSSNQAYVLNKLGKYEAADELCTLALMEIQREQDSDQTMMLVRIEDVLLNAKSKRELHILFV